MDRFSSQRKTLSADIAEYSGRLPSPCKSVGITLKYPTHSDLTSDQLQYYTYWKSTVGTEDFRKAADGYVWLLVCELINDPDREKASRILNELCTSSAGDTSPFYPELLPTALEYSMMYGTPMPGYREWMSVDETMPWLLASPVSDLPLTYIKDNVQDIPDPEEFRSVLGTVLREYDILLGKQHKSLKRICLTPVKESTLPFRNYVHLGEKTPVERIIWNNRSPDMFRKILGFIAGVYLRRGTESSDIPLASELEHIILTVMKERSFTESPDPFSKKGNQLRFLGTMPTAMGPSCLDDNLATNRGDRRMTFGDLLTFSPARTSVPAKFVCSDMEHPAYDDLSAAQYSYYTYWKSCFEKGTYLDTDNGYVNLYLTELINGQDIRSSEESIRKLYEIYGGSACIPAALIDHIIGNGGKVSDFGIYTDRLVINTWLEDFIRGCNQSPLNQGVLNLMRSGSANIRFMGHPLPLDIFETILHRIFSNVSSKKGIAEVFSAEKITVKRSIFFDLDYFRGPKETVVRYTNYLGSRKFTNFIDKAAKYASDVLNSYENGTPLKKSAFNLAGVSCSNIIAEELFVWHSANLKSEPKQLRLDASAIATAESDLRIVTDLMKVEEEDEQEVQEEIIQTSAEGDPWTVFFATLDDDERSYLKLCLEGSDTSAMLKGLKRTRNKMDDMINSKALDSFGDTLLEDGEIVEDYLEEIQKGL